jgi:TolB-like protein/Tfp pilus assembly protein PilF
MATQGKPEIPLEIGHILFIDTVGYSKLSTAEQHALLASLNRVVRSSECFRTAEARGSLMRLPTGDGMALVFDDAPESPIECAIEICRALQDLPELQLRLRMGIHSGPVSRVVDVNDRCNLAGAGINIAERVMTSADASHILLSKRAADDLAEDERWRPYLHDLGECEGKHGTRLHLVNFYTDEFGNPERPNKFKREEEARRLPTEPSSVRLRMGRGWTWGISLAVAIVLLGFYFFYLARRQPPVSPPAKSIAVLPFDNLSDDKQNHYFTDGVQDEILSDLAKVADLKVISRTSVMRYDTAAKRDLREIVRALDVANVLEGSVQRANGRVRVTVQLIDARADTSIWSDHYDREVTDVFAIQSEIAEKIVAQLKAKLSPHEKAAIEEPPTDQLAAYDLYVRAKSLGAGLTYNARNQDNLFEIVTLLKQAVELDPGFLLAYCALARAHDQIYLLGFDHTPERLRLANEAAQAALRLNPDSGPAHLAVAYHLYGGLLDYNGARAELAIAQKALPNEALIPALGGYIDRRQGRIQESITAMRRALELDPQNIFLLQQLTTTYECIRRYPEMAATLDRALALGPHDPGTRAARALIPLQQAADSRPVQAVLQSVLAENPEAAGDLAKIRFYVALCDRNSDEAKAALATMPAGGCREEGLAFPDTWCEGLADRLSGNEAAAHSAFEAAHAEAEHVVAQQPDYPEGLCVLGTIDAALGRKDEAIAEGRRAVELLPVSRDSINGELMLEYLAMIYAWTGEPDQAIAQLAIAARLPGELTYGDLRLNPIWDAIRGKAGFDAIVASLAPAPKK